jgi:phospholipid/cholesterol/gamma-HCH transport system ATP-binding protein
MRKRVGVARAVINRPAVLLYDEPTTGLDPANAENMHALIRRIADETGATSLVVTHDARALASFADRVVTLTDGRVVTDAAPQTGRLAWT